MTRLTDGELKAALASHEILSDTGGPDMTSTPAHRALAQVESEHEAANRFWLWVLRNESQYPALRWLTHHEAGGYRPDGVAARLRAEGQKAGFPDYALYWGITLKTPIFAQREYVGWAMELKRADRTNGPSDLQVEWLEHLELQGWKSVVCYGADEAIESLKEYLEGK